jgi:hypothetical protein
MMKKDGLQRMMDFLNFLDKGNIHYFITKYSDDGLTATLTLVGARIEVEFTPDEMQYSIFRGNEDVSTDDKSLMDLIKRDME